jgi:hypothetical protein
MGAKEKTSQNGLSDDRFMVLLSHLVCAESRVLLDKLKISDLVSNQEESRLFIMIPMCTTALQGLMEALIELSEHEELLLSWDQIMSIHRLLDETFKAIQGFLAEIQVILYSLMGLV